MKWKTFIYIYISHDFPNFIYALILIGLEGNFRFVHHDRLGMEGYSKIKDNNAIKVNHNFLDW